MIITPEDSRWLNTLANAYRTEIAQTPVSLQESQAKNLYNIIEGIQTALQVDLSEAQVQALISALSQRILEGAGRLGRLSIAMDKKNIRDSGRLRDAAIQDRTLDPESIDTMGLRPHAEWSNGEDKPTLPSALRQAQANAKKRAANIRFHQQVQQNGQQE